MSRTKLLTADQSTMIRKMIRSVLSKRSRDSKRARTVKNALAGGRDEKFDLILLEDAPLDAGHPPVQRRAGPRSRIGRIFLAVRKAGRDAAGRKAVAMRAPSRKSRIGESVFEARPSLNSKARLQAKKPDSITFDRIQVNFRTRDVLVRGQTIRLTAKEFKLLRYLIENSNSALPHGKILQAVWGAAYRRKVEYLRVFINRLRQKIELNPSNPRYLLTEPWFGYRFQLPQKA